MIKTALFILILLFIVRMIAFFAGSETAYLSITRIKLRQMVRAKKKNAKTAEKLRNNMDELLTVILIGINFLNTNFRASRGGSGALYPQSAIVEVMPSAGSEFSWSEL